MKPTKIYLVIIALLIVITSCEEPFSPRADYDERYSFNCVVRGDTAFQVATTYKSYDVSYLDPYENTTDPFIHNSFIRMWVGDSVYVFRDSSIERTDNSRYDTPVNFYYINNYKPRSGDFIEMETLLPNGRRLKSSTNVPERVEFNFASSDRSFPTGHGGNVNISWIPAFSGQLFSAKIVLNYRKIEDGVSVRYTKEIPIQYVEENGNRTPVYPIPRKTPILQIPSSIIEEILLGISEGDENKQNYIIFAITVELKVFDRNLSGYYSSVSRIDDSFSIRLDELDFSNIDGGFGVFGSYVIDNFAILFDDDYIKSLGYRIGTGN
ncbi:MAG: DUF4249 domain-containing protein [Melioribacteraceae bacterium]|nr:DUF4249 domain-containing protein [Melioribacteraceae bacterium]